jgi:hypothetical protein
LAYHLAINAPVRNCIATLAALSSGTKIESAGVVRDVRAKFLVAFAAVVCFGPPASAELLSETLENFGFFGRWAMSCEEPASPANTVRTARLSPTGDAIFTESLGGGEPNSYVILRAKRSDADTLALRTKLNGDITQDLTMYREGDRLRTMSNRDVPSGRFVVRNGVVVGSKQNTPWLTRCQ